MSDATAGPLLLGGNALFDVPFPLAVGNRYIHLRVDAGEPVCQIWRWDEERHQAVREPDPGEQAGPGLILKADRQGGLELDFTALPGGIFGDVTAEDLRVTCTPDALEVRRGDRVAMVLSRNSITGSGVGVHIRPDGIAMGSHLPVGFEYQLDYVGRRVVLPRMIRSAYDPMLSDLRFVACDIEGPAILAAVQDVEVTRATMILGRFPRESVFVDLPWPVGCIPLRHVAFEDCRFVNVAFLQGSAT